MWTYGNNHDVSACSSTTKGYPTKNGVSINLSRWKELVEKADEIMETVQKLVADQDVKLFHHLGGNIHVSVNTGVYSVDLRQWWLPEDSDTLRPTRRGIGLRLLEWEKLKCITWL